MQNDARGPQSAPVQLRTSIFSSIRVSRWLLGLLAVFYWTASAAESDISARSLDLGEVVQVTVERQARDSAGKDLPGFQTSTWLAGLPTIGMLFLESDESQGSDEAEISINLPLKSPFGRRQDEQLRALATSIARAETERRQLYFSGLLRETVWSERVENTRLQYTERKITLLEKLLNRQQDLFEARSASRYSLLLIQQEITKAKLLLQDQRRAQAQWQQRYRLLTGLGSLPDAIEEPAPAIDAPWRNHPELRLLDLTREQQRTRIAAASAKSSPWNLALIARNQETPQLDENQYGIALEVPLSAFDTVSQANSNEWREAQRDSAQRYDELLISLQSSWQELTQEAEHLQRRQVLLDESLDIGKQLIEESRSLLGQNEIASEIWVRRLLDSLDTEAEGAINRVLIGQNRAMSRQAAGIPL